MRAIVDPTGVLPADALPQGLSDLSAKAQGWLLDTWDNVSSRWLPWLVAEFARLHDLLRHWFEAQGLSGDLAELGLWLGAGALLLWLARRLLRTGHRNATSTSIANKPAGVPPDAFSRVGPSRQIPDHIASYLRAGAAVVVLMVGGVGGWAAVTELASAVLATGTVVVDSKVKKVQHPTGGVVGEIRVKDGDAVKVGDVLVRLDETVTRANLDTVTKQLDELAVRNARLSAELSGANHVLLPAELKGRELEPGVATTMASERALFASRRSAREGQRSQLRERIAQLRSEIDGLLGQGKSKSSEISLTEQELKRLQVLEAENLVPATKMNSTRRDLTRLAGEQSQLQSSLAQAKEKIAETELQIIQLDEDMRSEVGKDMRELQGKQNDLIERKIAAEDQLRRIDIRAPQAGIVHQLEVHTIGGVIMAGEPIMMIVPEDDSLVIEAKISPVDIDHVRADQLAYIRFPAFNQRTTPELSGHVILVSADLTRDSASNSPNQPYYLARIALTPDEKVKLAGMRLVPGMPAEVHIETPRRTALSYLVKPLTDQIALAFKER